LPSGLHRAANVDDFSEIGLPSNRTPVASAQHGRFLVER
jgi:hypothetical protein